MNTEKNNVRVLELMSAFLNEAADSVTPKMVRGATACGVTEDYAYALLVALTCGLKFETDEDTTFFRAYFLPMFGRLDAAVYRENLYYKTVKFPRKTLGNWTLKLLEYKPYEAFVRDDFRLENDGRLIPQIGYFSESFAYPAVLENGREWMTVTPNEIETMKHPIARARGKVLTYGLGLGYFAFSASEKSEVESVTVVERDASVISLFEEFLLPQFPNREKIKIVKADAFDYARRETPNGGFDFIFADLWHDVGDGIDLYLEMKKFEKLSPASEFAYWIEKSILCYI